MGICVTGRRDDLKGSIGIIFLHHTDAVKGRFPVGQAQLRIVGFARDEPLCHGIRADLRETLRCTDVSTHAGRQATEIILKDTHTFEHDSTRPGRWVEIAREEIERAG